MTKTELSPEERLTVSEYDRVAHLWAPAHDTQEFWTPEFEIFEKLVPSGSSVVELGSGGGRDARRLSQRYRYLGVDLSRKLISEAQQVSPNLCFRQSDLYRMPFIANLFDSFWCSATLLHLPKVRVDEALTEIHRVIRPGGVGFISLKEGEGELVTKEVIASMPFKRFFAYYKQEEFESVLERNRFSVVDNQSYIKPVGHTNWLVYFVETSK